MNKTWRSWFFLLAVLLSSTILRGQTNQGILAGTVLDPTGAAVEGATIVAKNEATGSALNSTTGTGGTFRFPSVAIGLYDLTATHPGFSATTQTGVNVQISTTTAITITLEVGKAEQTVTVAADVTHIETESSDVGTVITSRQVVDLPLALGGVGAMRSPESFVFLAPGTAGPGTGNSNNGVFISKIGGGQNFGNEILLEGTSTLRSENGSSFDEASPSVEAISEFRVLTSTIPAIYGRTTGGIETFSIKSGTNQFHGTAYDILQNEAFNANSWFNNGYAARCAAGDATCRAQYARPIDKKNDYGGNLGGPVIIPKLYNGRDKTFFFFNWEQFRQNLGGSLSSKLPTAAERGGDFTDVLGTTSLGTNPCDGTPVFAGEIFDPASTKLGPGGLPCRTSFLVETGKNAIPGFRLSKVAQNFLGLLPPTNTATQPNGVNYVLSSTNPVYNTTYTVRVDQSLSDKSKFFGTYDSRENSRYTTPAFNLPPPLESTGQTQDFITHYGRAGWDYIFSPTVLNHLALGWNRTNSKNFSLAALQASAGKFSWDTKVGITGLNGGDFPATTVGESIPGFGITRNADYLDDGVRANDTVTWVKGNHSFTLGFDFRNQVFSILNQEGSSGTFGFGRCETAASQQLCPGTGYGFASFMLGEVDNAGATIRAHTPRWVSQYYSTFVQDDWKVTPSLTLNLGLRWELDRPRSESYNNTSNFSSTTPNPAAGNLPGAMVFGNACQGCNPRWADTKYHDVGPRIGFAFNPNHGPLVFRGGYGLIYGALQYTDFGNNQIQGYAATPSFHSANGFDPAFNWDNGFPSFAPPPFINPSVVNGGDPNYIQPRFGQPAIVQSWSFQVQGQISKDMVATLGYVGQRAQNLRSALMNINNIPLQDLALGDALNQGVPNNSIGVTAPYAGFTGPVWQAIRPYPQYDYIYMDVLQNIGQSTYESLQASLQRRMSAGLSLQASFTWAKSITDADSSLPGTNAGIQQVQNPDALSQEKSLSSQDVPYTFTTALLYQLPFGKDKSFLKGGIVGAILGGWQIGAVLRYQAGVPISYGCASGIPGWQNCIRFDRVPGVSPLSQGVLSGKFDPFADNYFSPQCGYVGQSGCGFADPNTELLAPGSSLTVRNARGGAYQLGDFPRNNGDTRGPNYYNEDFSVIRNFRIKEALSFQIKAEFLNAFNRHIFSVPDTFPNDPNFGLVTGTIDVPRVVQFTGRITF